MRVDSGAVISLLCRSVADLLGVSLESGQHVVMTGIGQKQNDLYVHKLTARIGDSPELSARFAVSPSEDVPNLLGRLDFFDRFQVDFDPSLEETRFTAPWLDAVGREDWQRLLDTERDILDKWSEYPLQPDVDGASRRFVTRAAQLVAAGAGLAKLNRGFELPSLIRPLFELSVQYEYLMRDPEPRARRYLDFEHVTKRQLEQAWLALPGPVGDELRKSPMRVKGEIRNKADYDRVISTFRRSGKPRNVLHWYDGTFRDIARAVDRDAEYKAVYGLYSAWAHGDPWTAGLEQLGHNEVWHLCIYWARLLKRVADAKKIILAAESYEGLRTLAKGFVEY